MRFLICSIILGGMLLGACRSDGLPLHQVEIVVVSTDSVVVDGIRVSTDDLVNTLGALPASPETEIVIVADTALPMGHLTDIEDRLRAASYERLNVRTIEAIE